MDIGWFGLTLDSSSLDLINPNRFKNNNHRRFLNPLTMSRMGDEDDQKTNMSIDGSEFRFPVSLSGIRDREDDDSSSGVGRENDREVPGEVDFFSDKKSRVCQDEVDDAGLRVKKEEQDDRTDVNVSSKFSITRIKEICFFFVKKKRKEICFL